MKSVKEWPKLERPREHRLNKLENKKITVVLKFLFLFPFLLLLTSANGASPDFLKNSIGIISAKHAPLKGYYEGPPKRPGTLADISSACNGFLVKKGDKVYFLSVKHILTKYAKDPDIHSQYKFIVTEDDKVAEVEITLPGLRQAPFRIPLTDTNKFEVPEQWYGLQYGTADAMAIDVTEHMGAQNLDGKVTPYELLSSISEQAMVNSHEQLTFLGYRDLNGVLVVDLQWLRGKWNKNFGGIINLGDQRLRGFSFGIKLSHGDCGSPLFLFNESKIHVIGLMRTGNYTPDFPSVATDSMVLRDAINRKEKSERGYQ